MEKSGANSAPSQPTAGRTQLPFVVSAWLVILLAAILRFIYIGRFEIWLDEAYCFTVARKDLLAIFADLANDNGPPLHYVALHYWMGLFGESPLAMRSLSAVASTATVAVLVFWKAPWFPERSRLLAGFLLAITPISVFYAQQVRMYAILVLILLSAMVFLERGLRLGRLSDWCFFSILTAAGLYTSYVAIYLVPVGYVAIVAMAFSREWRGVALSRFRQLLPAHVAAAILFIPWLPVFAVQPSSAATAWIRLTWPSADKPLLPLTSLSLMTTGGAYYPSHLGNLYQGPEWTEAVRQAVSEGAVANPLLAVACRVPPEFALALSAILACAALIVSFRRDVALPWKALLWSWLVLSFAVPYALSFRWPMFVPGRYELPGVPAFVILCAAGISGLPSAWRRVFIAGAVLLFMYTWTYMFVRPTVGPNTLTAQALCEVASPGDVLMCEGFEYAPTYYYAGARRDSLGFMTVPRDMVLHSGWFDFDRWFPGGNSGEPSAALAEDLFSAVAEAVAAARPGGAVIIVRRVRPASFDRTVSILVDAAVKDCVRAGTLAARPELSRPDCGVIVYQRVP